MEVCNRILYFSFNENRVKNLFCIKRCSKFAKYWISRVLPIEGSIFDDVVRKMLMSTQFFIYFETIRDGIYNCKVSCKVFLNQKLR